MIPRENLLDVVWAIAAFAMSFFYIVIIWLVHSRFFDDYPLYDEMYLGLNFVILRFSNVYGSTRDLQSRVIPKFMRRALEEKPIFGITFC